MKSTHDIIRERLYLRAGLNEKPKPRYNLSDLERSEWSPKFEHLMRCNLLMGALRYGTIEENRKRKKKYNRLDSVRKRLDRYSMTGNDELLVDCANLLLLEFELGQHPHKHYAGADTREHHVDVFPAGTGDTVRSIKTAVARAKEDNENKNVECYQLLISKEASDWLKPKKSKPKHWIKNNPNFTFLNPW